MGAHHAASDVCARRERAVEHTVHGEHLAERAHSQGHACRKDSVAARGHRARRWRILGVSGTGRHSDEAAQLYANGSVPDGQIEAGPCVASIRVRRQSCSAEFRALALRPRCHLRCPCARPVARGTGAAILAIVAATGGSGACRFGLRGGQWPRQLLQVVRQRGGEHCKREARLKDILRPRTRTKCAHSRGGCARRRGWRPNALVTAPASTELSKRFSRTVALNAACRRALVRGSSYSSSSSCQHECEIHPVAHPPPSPPHMSQGLPADASHRAAKRCQPQLDARGDEAEPGLLVRRTQRPSRQLTSAWWGARAQLAVGAWAARGAPLTGREQRQLRLLEDEQPRVRLECLRAGENARRVARTAARAE